MSIHLSRRPLLALWIATVLAVFPTTTPAATAERGPQLGSMRVGKILFLGNSITLHGPAPKIGWTGNWGMAASAPEKDYVHLLLEKIAKAAGGMPKFKVRNIADFERQPSDFDIPKQLRDELAFEPDVVILAIGENVPALKTDADRRRFAGALDGLLAAIKAHGNPRIFVRGQFWPDADKDSIMKQAGERAGADFVDLGKLGADPANAASAERKFEHAGVAAHPGDRGMAAIANALWRALQRASIASGRSLELILKAESESELAPHGEGNIYAPDVHREGTKYRMWYGGQGRDGHDRIHLAESEDGKTWHRRGVVLEDPSANHVNDPSVVRVGDTYWMYYTRAARGIIDEIALATSSDGVRWEPKGIVLAPGAVGEWDSLLVGRPSVLHQDGEFKLWYDGRKDLQPGALAAGAPTAEGSRRHVGHATSKDGVHWTKHPRTPVFDRDAGGVDVKRVGDSYLMVYESHEGTCLAVSRDGVAWTDRGLWVERSGGDLDRHGHVTPMLLVGGDPDTAELFVGAARAGSWDRNRIARIGIDLTPIRINTGGSVSR